MHRLFNWHRLVIAVIIVLISCIVTVGLLGILNKKQITCGNATIASNEQCDDGNSKNGDGCSSTCHVEKGWKCGGSPSSCHKSCGDGAFDTDEQCDDGNTRDKDGCSAECTIEMGWKCIGSPGKVSSCSEA